MDRAFYSLAQLLFVFGLSLLGAQSTPSQVELLSRRGAGPLFTDAVSLGSTSELKPRSSRGSDLSVVPVAYVVVLPEDASGTLAADPFGDLGFAGDAIRVGDGNATEGPSPHDLAEPVALKTDLDNGPSPSDLDFDSISQTDKLFGEFSTISIAHSWSDSSRQRARAAAEEQFDWLFETLNETAGREGESEAVQGDSFIEWEQNRFEKHLGSEKANQTARLGRWSFSISSRTVMKGMNLTNLAVHTGRVLGDLSNAVGATGRVCGLGREQEAAIYQAWLTFHAASESENLPTIGNTTNEQPAAPVSVLDRVSPVALEYAARALDRAGIALLRLSDRLESVADQKVRAARKGEIKSPVRQGAAHLPGVSR